MPRFFNYTDTASPEYKTELEGVLSRLDKSSSIATYTPMVSVFCIAIVGALQTGLSSKSSISPYYAMVQLILSAGTVLILGIAKITEKKSKQNCDKLIEHGVKEGFFKPDRTIQKEKGDVIRLHLEIDATKLRLMHTPS